ncbi:hypothetical protein [Stenotrophomonas pigmentata]|nr:hypothetical protein [Stenotrophomonas sp. 610A2]
MKSKFKTPLITILAIGAMWGFIWLVEGTNHSVNTLAEAAQGVEWSIE